MWNLRPCQAALDVLSADPAARLGRISGPASQGRSEDADGSSLRTSSPCTGS
jgi:hypothetical protein